MVPLFLQSNELLRLVFVKNLQTKFCFTLKCKKQQTSQALDPVKLDKITATRIKNQRVLYISTLIVHYNLQTLIANILPILKLLKCHFYRTIKENQPFLLKFGPLYFGGLESITTDMTAKS